MLKSLILLFSLLALAPSHLAKAEETAADVIERVISQAASADADVDQTLRWLRQALDSSDEIKLLDMQQIKIKNAGTALSKSMPKDVFALLEDEKFFRRNSYVFFSRLDFTNDGRDDLVASHSGGSMHCVRYRFFSAIEDGYFLQVDGPDTRVHQMEGGLCGYGGQFAGTDLELISFNNHNYFLLADSNSLRITLDLFDVNSPFWVAPVARITANREMYSVAAHDALSTCRIQMCEAVISKTALIFDALDEAKQNPATIDKLFSGFCDGCKMLDAGDVPRYGDEVYRVLNDIDEFGFDSLADNRIIAGFISRGESPLILVAGATARGWRTKCCVALLATVENERWNFYGGFWIDQRSRVINLVREGQQ